MTIKFRVGLVLGCLAAIAGCSDDETVVATTATSTTSSGTAGSGGEGTGGSAGGSGGAGGMTELTVYDFDSHIAPGTSSVSYSGQVFRQVLIEDSKRYVGGMTVAIDSQAFEPATVQDVVDALDYYYVFDTASSGQDDHGFVTDPATLQAVYDDIATDKKLQDKLAGNDAVTDHEDWSTEFEGWTDADIAASCGAVTPCGVGTPEGLYYAFVTALGQQAVDRVNGIVADEPGTTTDIPVVYVTPTGLDLRELMQKHLTMSVAFSQGTDDYLDDDVADKGLLSPNTQDEDKPYTVLEHAWDEAFGYFGAARDYALHSDDEIANEGYHDSDGDDAIDLTREFNFGASVNAAKRDLGSDESAMTDFSGDAIAGFLEGRAIIASLAGAEPSNGQLMQLETRRDEIVEAWEKAIAATMVHYINEVLVDMGNIGGGSYVFVDHAKHWSELKGFALGLQYNPRSLLDATDFAELHTLLGDAPVLATATTQEQMDYEDDLLAARALLMNAYDFDQANVEAW